MAMSILWAGMAAISFLFGIGTGRLPDVTNAVMEGATGAVNLCLSMAGTLCLWSGVMEIMDRSGITAKLATGFRPLLRLLLPEATRDPETLSAVSACVAANLLGLGSAATPLGIRAACRMARGCNGTASDDLCTLVVLNTASIQLIPTAIASVRAASGALSPFDILPAVWFSSLLSVSAGLLSARLLACITAPQRPHRIRRMQAWI